MSDVGRDLRAAAQILREKGWRGNRHNSRDGYYLTGAIAQATADGPSFKAAKTAFESHVGRAEAEFYEMDAGRTAEEVIAALEAAATQANEGG